MAGRTTTNPKRNFVTLRLTDDEARTLDAAASRTHLSRSAYVRECVRRVTAADAKRKSQEP